MKRVFFLAVVTVLLLSISVSAHGAPNASFSDVPSGYWASKQIHSLANYNIVSGGADGRFRPSENLTRSELAKLLTLAYMLRKSTALNYSDFSSTHWACDVAAQAVAAGWMNGFPDNTFRPDKPATRAQVAKILVKANNYSAPAGAPVTFTDVSSGYWASADIQAAASYGIISGYPDGTFRPNAQITRAEAAALIYRALCNKDYLLESSTVGQITYERYRRFLAAGPVNINILKIPRAANTSFGLGQDKLAAREILSSIARRKGALAAVNADYFSFKPGGPSGVMVDGGIIFSSPINNRSYLGFLAGNSPYIDKVSMAASITPAATGRSGTISWVNKVREKGSDTIFVFSPLFGNSTLTEDTGTEATVRLNGPITPNQEVDGTVIDVRYGSGNSPIPPDCVVLSAAAGSGRDYLTANMVLGDAVRFKFSLEPNWQNETRAIGGGPRLVRNGQADVENEAFTSEQLKGRNARTGVGIDAGGNLIVCVVDGKRDFFSIGMSLYELAADLKSRGAVDAMAFDSGGSSTLYFNGSVKNNPTDGAERPISNALLFLP